MSGRRHRRGRLVLVLALVALVASLFVSAAPRHALAGAVIAATVQHSAQVTTDESPATTKTFSAVRRVLLLPVRVALRVGRTMMVALAVGLGGGFGTVIGPRPRDVDKRERDNHIVCVAEESCESQPP
jgi:hypothetical protein